MSEFRAILCDNKIKKYPKSSKRKDPPSTSATSIKTIVPWTRRASVRAKIDIPVTLHTLRHSYAFRPTNNGVNIQYLQGILGHKSPKTTMKNMRIQKQGLAH